MTNELTSLAQLIQRRMAALGIESQAELARVAELTPQDINRFFSGGTKLPTAAKRRKLAKALGVSHLDLLVAAGEITEDEIRAAGVEGVVERDPDPRKERLLTLVRTAAIPNPFYIGLIPMLEALQPGAPQVHEAVERSGANGQ